MTDPQITRIVARAKELQQLAHDSRDPTTAASTVADLADLVAQLAAIVGQNRSYVELD